jgi:hypothetical protein
MEKLNITKEKLLENYNKSIDKLTDECDWITHISGQMVCDVIVSILLEYNINCLININKLY